MQIIKISAKLKIYIGLFFLFIFNIIIFASAGCCETTSINLLPGWSFISLPAQPTDNNIQSVLKDISSNVRVVWGYDNQNKNWLKYSPSATSYQSSVDLLSTIDSGKGYWIYMNNPGALKVEIQPSTLSPIQLFPGWNLIGYHWVDDLKVEEAFSTVKDYWIAVWSWEDGAWKEKLSPKYIEVGTSLSITELLSLRQGRAYWLKMKDDYNAADWQPDLVPPSVLSVYPADASINVPIDTPVTVTLDERIDPSTINASTFYINGISGEVEYDGNTARLIPYSNLSYSTYYTVNLTNGIKDIAGNPLASTYTWSFTTLPLPDTVSPAIVSISPSNKSVNVPANSKVSVVFSEEMDSATINNKTLAVSSNSTSVNGTVSYNADTKTATFTPLNELSKGHTYTITVSDGCKDIAGNALTSSYTWTFTVIESAAGVWSGTFTSNVLYKTYNILGVVTEAGEARFMSIEGAQFTGNISVNGSTMTSTATAFAPPGSVFVNGSSYGTIKFTGNVKTRESMNGTYNGVGDNGTFALAYDAVYERASSLSLVSGNWYNTDATGYSQHMTVDVKGAFTGYNSYGCTFIGNVKIINSSYNAYRLENVKISSCGLFDGTYNGIGVVWDNITVNDIFTFGISKSYASMVLNFKR